MKYDNGDYLIIIDNFKPLIEKLINKYQNLLYLDADDIRQEIYIKIMLIVDNKKDTLGDDIYPYINVCIKNTVMDLIRETSRTHLEILYDDMKHLEKIEDHVRVPLKDLMKGLSEEEIKVACLYMDGLYQEEIGQLLGLKQQKVSRILKEIRKKIEKNM
jgi:RNA polymerase sigma factor (sigma-70 family)